MNGRAFSFPDVLINVILRTESTFLIKMLMLLFGYLYHVMFIYSTEIVPQKLNKTFFPCCERAFHFFFFSCAVQTTSDLRHLCF